ncbi:MAG: preprotein translocase subunit SecA [Lentisphaerae bacterium]|nr:preprotein translocase subunit SecA [Lentisphaerota bacterium]
MLKPILRLLGTKRQKDTKKLLPLVARINEIEKEYQSLTDDQLKAKTPEFKQRIAGGALLDDVLCEAFAAVKNACRRLHGTTVSISGADREWDMIPYDVQLMGGIVLHQGKIAEMATGEGKTLVATMPLYLNALSGRNVHLVTYNDYLARRDAHWMSPIYDFLGVSVGCIQNTMGPEERRVEYAKDITYGTNSEFGFDYLRDNGMATVPEHQVQRGHAYAIVDEVDSILIDEARTPLIISGPAPVSTHQYFELKPRVELLVRRQRELCNTLVQEARDLLSAGKTEEAQFRMYQVKQGMPKHKQLMHLLEDPDTRKLQEQVERVMLTDMRKEQARALREELYFTIDERGHDATLTEKGCRELNPSDPESYVIPDLASELADLDVATGLSERETLEKRQAIQTRFADRSEKIHNVDQLIRAYCVYERDVDYVVQDNQVLIVDEFTGRILPGRRWADGLHQAVEAKEGAKIERETQTLATVTIQNYFRMYDKLAGMTGTAETEASEFHDIYKLDVVVIPTNRPVRRVDRNDVIYKTQREKFKAIIDEIADCNKRGQPVLVGTVSVDTSEVISRMLRRARIEHSVLNAKNHEREAEIVARAGQAGAVTIATNMAGRGTDIKLGPGVVHVDRKVIVSGLKLDDRYEGATLRKLLEERPCGLHVIGSERHESRRIDRQLRGRCARQGDPGSSRFYVSLEDDLMRMFGSDRIAGIMSRLGLEEGQQLEHKWLNRSIETAQRRVEQQNFGYRKRTLEYDDVMNRQREVIYGLRGGVVSAAAPREFIYDILHDLVVTRIEELISGGDTAVKECVSWVQSTFPVPVREDEIKARAGNPEELGEWVFAQVKGAYDLKIGFEDGRLVGVMERQLVLHAIDSHWQDYLRSMDVLRQGVGLRAYGQRDPLVEYKKEAYGMFGELMDNIKQEIALSVFRSATSLDSFQNFMRNLPIRTVHEHVSALGGGSAAQASPRRPSRLPEGILDAALPDTGGSSAGSASRGGPRVGRNDPCPCGSGKKFKKCCGE